MHRNGVKKDLCVDDDGTHKVIPAPPLPPFKPPLALPTAPPRCGMQMLNAALYAARRKAAEQQSQNKKLFSDITIGAFRCAK